MSSGEDKAVAIGGAGGGGGGQQGGLEARRKLLGYNASSVDAGSMPTSDLFDALGVSAAGRAGGGLDASEAAARLDQYGPNELGKPEPTPLWKLILEQFQDRLVQILLIVAVLSAAFSVSEVLAQAGSSSLAAEETSLLQSFVEPLVILAILVVNAAIGVLQSRSASDSLEALRELQPRTCTVFRDGGTAKQMSASELVPGDMVSIRVGDKIPADCRLVSLQQSTTLQVDEASLTGESVTVAKLPGDEGTTKLPNMPVQDQRGMLYAGTVVTRGSGMAVVTQTGMATQMGKIQQGVDLAKAEVEKTPLAKRLDTFGDSLAKASSKVYHCV